MDFFDWGIGPTFLEIVFYCRDYLVGDGMQALLKSCWWRCLLEINAVCSLEIDDVFAAAERHFVFHKGVLGENDAMPLSFVSCALLHATVPCCIFSRGWIFGWSFSWRGTRRGMAWHFCGLMMSLSCLYVTIFCTIWYNTMLAGHYLSPRSPSRSLFHPRLQTVDGCCGVELPWCHSSTTNDPIQ